MDPSVVLILTADIGHVTPMVELAKLFVSSNFSVTVIILEFISIATSNQLDSFISSISDSYPNKINFHRLPKIPLPSSSSGNVVPFGTQYESLHLASPDLLSFLKKEIPTCNIRALVVNMFCTVFFGVADELGLPKYVFYSSNAASLAANLALPYIQSKLQGSFRDLGEGTVDLPGHPPVPAFDILEPLQDRSKMNDIMIGRLDRFWCADDGFIVNSFDWLERRAVGALANDVIVPGRRNPPVYCVGPLAGGATGGGQHECLDWLDQQPQRSVVFLCFGSMGVSFSHEQVMEIEAGLKRSGQRFLWAVKDPLVEEGSNGLGMVVKTWVPQKEILNHAAVGAFVSHGGWNSTLEAMSAGVPMVVWPLYAEQGLNRVLLVEEARIAVGIEGYKKGLVRAEEIEKKIRWVMESEEGKEMKRRVAQAKMESEMAWTENGSSKMAWSKVVRLLKDGK